MLQILPPAVPGGISYFQVVLSEGDCIVSHLAQTIQTASNFYVIQATDQTHIRFIATVQQKNLQLVLVIPLLYLFFLLMPKFHQLLMFSQLPLVLMLIT